MSGTAYTTLGYYKLLKTIQHIKVVKLYNHKNTTHGTCALQKVQPDVSLMQ